MGSLFSDYYFQFFWLCEWVLVAMLPLNRSWEGPARRPVGLAILWTSGPFLLLCLLPKQAIVFWALSWFVYYLWWDINPQPTMLHISMSHSLCGTHSLATSKTMNSWGLFFSTFQWHVIHFYKGLTFIGTLALLPFSFLLFPLDLKMLHRIMPGFQYNWSSQNCKTQSYWKLISPLPSEPMKQLSKMLISHCFWESFSTDETLEFLV